MVLATLDTLRENTVTELPDAKKNQRGIEFFNFTQRGPILPAWATRERERVLVNFYRHDYNWMVQGAFTGIGNIVASTPRHIIAKEQLTDTETKYWKTACKAVGKPSTGDTPNIDFYNSILEQADFGRGWMSFVKKVALEYLRHDCGAFIEIIAPGNPLEEPTGPVMGLAVLDSLRCIPTGDPEYPVIYYDRYAKFHLLHRTRVTQIVDTPDTDEVHPGYGLCALSRAISISYREILMGRYIESSLDDKPPPGIVVAKGMTKQERDKALMVYNEDLSRDEQPPWGKQLWFYAADPSLDVGLQVESFTQAPEKFDFKVYTAEIDVDALALAIGVDRQDLWELSGRSLGSGAQSEIMAQKSRGKTIGNLRDEIERAIDNILPEGMDFELQYADPQEDNEKADIAGKWALVVKNIGTDLTVEERRQLLANNSEGIKDAISDENGKLNPAPELPKPSPNVGVNPNANPNAPAPKNTDAASTQDTGQAPAQTAASAAKSRPDLGGWSDADLSEKAIQSTIIDFEDAFADTINARVKGDIGGLRFGVIARDLLRVYGLKALRDGLEDGGVPQTDENGLITPLDPDDQARYTDWLAQQSAYVTDFGRTLSTGAAIDGEARAQLWVNKSIKAMYDAGRGSADRNGMYLFTGDDGAESCKTCQRLKDQVHRMKDWERRRLRPGVDTQMFICGGWRCAHRLVKTTERAKGRF